MGLARNGSRATGSPLPLAEAAEQIYADAVERHPELIRKDFSSVYMYLETAAAEGRKVRFGDLEGSESATS